MAKGFAARDTPIRTASCVRAPDVYLQTVRRAEEFLARVAGECIVTVGWMQTDSWM